MDWFLCVKSLSLSEAFYISSTQTNWNGGQMHARICQRWVKLKQSKNDASILVFFSFSSSETLIFPFAPYLLLQSLSSLSPLVPLRSQCTQWFYIFLSFTFSNKNIIHRHIQAFTSLLDTLGTGSDVVISISASISDISSEKPFGIVISPVVFNDCVFLSDFSCRFWIKRRPITSVKHNRTPAVTEINRYKKNFSWFSETRQTKMEKRRKRKYKIWLIHSNVVRYSIH